MKLIFLISLTILSLSFSTSTFASIDKAKNLYAERKAVIGNSKAKEAADLLKPLVDQGNIKAMLPYIKALYFSAKYNMPSGEDSEKSLALKVYKEAELTSDKYLESVFPGSKSFISEGRTLEEIINKTKEVRQALKDIRNYAEVVYYRAASMGNWGSLLQNFEEPQPELGTVVKRVPELASNLLFCAELDADAGVQGCYRILSPLYGNKIFNGFPGSSRPNRKQKPEGAYNYLSSAFFNSLGTNTGGVSLHPNNTLDYAVSTRKQIKKHPKHTDAFKSESFNLLQKFVSTKSAKINPALVPEIEAKKIEAKKKIKEWKK